MASKTNVNTHVACSEEVRVALDKQRKGGEAYEDILRRLLSMPARGK